MTQLSVADVLEGAADLIEPEGRWCKGRAARTVSGRDCLADSPEAFSFCMWGAIARVSGDFKANDRAPIRVITKSWGEASTPDNLGAWNDAPGRTQSEVVAKLREAAALARQQESTSC